jgi:thioredoxin 1
MTVEVNTDTFEREVVQSNIPVLVDFWGPSCKPCLALMPEIDKIAEDYKQQIKVVKIDASKNRRLCLNLRVMGLPTFLFYSHGSEHQRLSGETIKARDIRESVEKILMDGND